MSAFLRLPSGPLRLWLDDQNWTVPPRFNVVARTATEAIGVLATGRVVEVSLDHDLGPPRAGTGYDVAVYIERAALAGVLPPLRGRSHSSNPIGRQRIEAALQQAHLFWCVNQLDKLQRLAEPLVEEA